MKLKSLLAACLATTAAFDALASDAGIFYERKVWNYKPSTGATTGLGLHTIGIYDTTGTISAGLGNMTRQRSAELGKQQDMERKGEVMGTYSWEERQPVANNGQVYRIMWSSEGSPWQNAPYGNLFSDKTDYTPSLLGLEIDYNLWSHEGAPISYGIGLGAYMYLMRLPNTVANGNISIPLSFTASGVPMNGLSVYATGAFGPWGYLRKLTTYNHFELGTTYELTDMVRLNVSYRTLNDYQSNGDLQNKSIKYNATSLSFGAGMYF